MRVALLAALIAASLIAVAVYGQSPPQDPGEISPRGQQAERDLGEPQVLEEGPIHEAFAETLRFEPEKAVVIDANPPEPVDEIPPEFKPEGDNVEWLPGYWMWDLTRKDFVWVSGVYRNIPPERVWVPGYWTEEDRGHVWVSGFWAAAEQQNVNYLPYPPESLENGPTSPAPGEDYFWVPGCWQYRNNNYAWQAGYWYQGNSDWVWVPNHYCYTPRGAVYVRGYWDYPIVRRGLLYAPVYWGNNYYATRRISYRPTSAILASRLLGSLYIHANYGYYYGNRGYYNNYRGFNPWYSAYTGYSSRRGYDPLLAYYAWSEGRNRDGWQNQLAQRWDRDGQRGRRGDFRDRDRRDDTRRQGEGAFSRDGVDGLVRSVRNLDTDSLRGLNVSRVDDRLADRFRENSQRSDRFREMRREAERGQRVGGDPSNRTADADRAGRRGFNLPDWVRDGGQATVDRGNRDGGNRSQFADRDRSADAGDLRSQGNRDRERVMRGFRGLQGADNQPGTDRGAVDTRRREANDNGNSESSRQGRPDFRPDMRERSQSQNSGMDQRRQFLERSGGNDPRRGVDNGNRNRTSFDRSRAFENPPSRELVPRTFQRGAESQRGSVPDGLRSGPSRDFRPQSDQRFRGLPSQSQRVQQQVQRPVQRSMPNRSQMQRSQGPRPQIQQSAPSRNIQPGNGAPSGFSGGNRGPSGGNPAANGGGFRGFRRGR